jgi:hypothetical protein
VVLSQTLLISASELDEFVQSMMDNAAKAVILPGWDESPFRLAPRDHPSRIEHQGEPP